MLLQSCPSCAGFLPPSAAKCPHCGHIAPPASASESGPDKGFIRGLAALAVSGAAAVTLMACYGPPPCDLAAVGDACKQNTDCCSNVCQGGKCLEGLPCKREADCMPGEICDATRMNTCQFGNACKRTTDCPIGQTCDASNKVCIPKPCTTAADCPQDNTCAIVCMPGDYCSSDTECPSGQACNVTIALCVPGPVSCKTDSDCTPCDRCESGSCSIQTSCNPTGAPCTKDCACCMGYCDTSSSSNGYCSQ